MNIRLVYLGKRAYKNQRPLFGIINDKLLGGRGYETRYYKYVYLGRLAIIIRL